MKKLPNKQTLLEAYRITGFRLQARVEVHREQQPPSFVMTLTRRQKKRHAAHAVDAIAAFMTGAGAEPVIWGVAGGPCISVLKCAV